VTDSTKKTDEELRYFIHKKYKINNPKDISKLDKIEKIKVISELKEKFPARQIQRMTGVPRGFIGRI